MTVYKNTKGKYYCRFQIDGERHHYLCRGATNEKEAKKLESQFMFKVQQQQNGVIAKDEKIKIKLKKLKESGVKYKCKINRVIPLSYVRFVPYIASKVECTYEIDGITYEILDGPYLLLPFEKLEKLSAIAYIGKNKSMLVLSRM